MPYQVFVLMFRILTLSKIEKSVVESWLRGEIPREEDCYCIHAGRDRNAVQNEIAMNSEWYIPKVGTEYG